MERMERVRFLQGAAFAAGLVQCRHSPDEILERLNMIAAGWKFKPTEVSEVSTTFSEAVADVLDAEKEALCN